MSLPNYEQLSNKFGEIIENSSNGVAKGVKFQDGTLVQYGHYDVKTDTSRSAGGLTYYSGSHTITLPYNFIDTEYEILTNITLANMNLFAQSYGAVSDRDKFALSFACTENNETRRINFMCIGRWKQ